MDMQKTVETERLIIRPWRESDALAMFEYARNPVVGPPAGWKPHDNADESLEIIRSMIKNGGEWAITEKGCDKPIGSIGLEGDRKRDYKLAYTMGYALGQEYWGRGYMTEAGRRMIEYAFDEMAAAILSIDHYPFNDRSRRVIEKLGFTREGTLRQAALRYDGVMLDEVCYSMTRAEFNALYGRG